jgi:hypothetical protein
MKRGVSTIVIIFAIIAVIAAGMFALFLWYWPFANVVGSGNLVSEQKDLSGFSVVDVEDGFEVDITQSSSYSISVTADDNVIDDVQVTKSGDTLNVGLRSDIYSTLSLRLEITMPDLYEVRFSGGTIGNAGEFTSTHDFVLDLSGGSRIELEGSAGFLKIDASGGSQLDLSGFSVDEASVNLSGGSIATINLDGSLDADLNGGSQLHYIGDVTLRDIETSGGSIVTKR